MSLNLRLKTIFSQKYPLIANAIRLGYFKFLNIYIYNHFTKLICCFKPLFTIIYIIFVINKEILIEYLL